MVLVVFGGAVAAARSASAPTARSAPLPAAPNITGLRGKGLVLTVTDATQSTADLPVAAVPGSDTQKVSFPAELSAGVAFDVRLKSQLTSPPQECAGSASRCLEERMHA